VAIRRFCYCNGTMDPRTLLSSQVTLFTRTEPCTSKSAIQCSTHLELPAQPIGKDGAEDRKLRVLNRAAFDQAYAQDQLRDHQQTVDYSRRKPIRARSGLEGVRLVTARGLHAARRPARDQNAEWR
jgi:hypothetical protein